MMHPNTKTSSIKTIGEKKKKERSRWSLEVFCFLLLLFGRLIRKQVEDFSLSSFR